MKVKIILFSLGLFFFAGTGFAQKNKRPKSFISEKAAINKYYKKSELQLMQKGELITIYSEIVQVLGRTLPYVAFATKPGITMATLGIPTNNENKKALDSQFESTDDYLKNLSEFYEAYLPYSDTGNLVTGILFYQGIIKSLHQYNDFR